MPNATPTPCPYQGPGQQNPVDIGGYDLMRPTDDPARPDYWIGTDDTVTYDAGRNNGQGADVTFADLVRVSKGAQPQSGCTAQITLDLEAVPAAFEYYPQHSLDVVFVLDVTSSMMKEGSRKMAQAKRAMIRTINMLWEQNRDSTVTIIPYGRDAMVPLPGGGLQYDYLGTLFNWKRSTAIGGYYIGQILGYRNGSSVPTGALDAFVTAVTPSVINVEPSLYNAYNYYKIRYGDVYDEAGAPRPDAVLQDYIATTYAAEPARYADNQIAAVAAGRPLTAQELAYSMNDGGYAGNTILDNAIWAIPYSEDTNSEAGLRAAYELLRTPGFAQSDDILRRAVVLITDGQANRSHNERYPGAYARPGHTDAAFAPAVFGQPWRYFLYLNQEMTQLVPEINNRSSDSRELVRAMDRLRGIGLKIKDPEDGNAQLFVLGIELDSQQPGPYSTEDIVRLYQSLATTPAFLRLASSEDPEGDIVRELEALIRDMFRLYAGSRVVVKDAINTALFDYVPGSLAVSGVRDGLLLKMPGEPDITDPGDPRYTVYVKEALLPAVSDADIREGVLTVDLGTVPFGLMGENSRTAVRFTYRIVSKGGAYGSHLHTDDDEESFSRAAIPAHPAAAESAVTYPAPPLRLSFQTPVIACLPDVTIEKFVLGDGGERLKRRELARGETARYVVVLTNHADVPAAVSAVMDASDVHSIREAVASPDARELSPGVTIPPRESVSIEYEAAFDAAGNHPNYGWTTWNGRRIYDNAMVSVLAWEADIAVTKTPDCACAAPCGGVAYTLRVVNNGPDAARNVVLTDRLPAGLSAMRYSADDGRSWQPWNGAYSIGDLAPGAAVTLRLAGMVGRCPPRALINTAAVSASTPDPDPLNNTAVATVFVVGSPDPPPTVSRRYPCSCSCCCGRCCERRP